MGLTVVRDVHLDAERPTEMYLVLTELQQEDGEHKKSVQHEECKHGHVSKVL